MYGLLNRAIECFVRDTYGDGAWADVAAACGLPGRTPEPLLPSPPGLSGSLVAAGSRHLGKSEADLLEDLGTYLVRHPRYEAFRRLLRFSGHAFGDFVLSLDELADRIRMVLPDADMFSLSVQAYPGRRFEANCASSFAGFPRLVCGALRAMADDYGVLATLEVSPLGMPGHARIVLKVHAPDFAEGREFRLGAGRA